MFSNPYPYRRLWLLIIAVVIVSASYPAYEAEAKKPSGWMDIFSDINYGGPDGYAMKLVEYDGMIVVGGEFTQIGGELSSIAEANNIAAFDGDEWLPLDTGITGGDLSRVFALAVYNGDLIVGGNFTAAGSAAARNIARWDGENWYPLAEGVGTPENTGRIYALFVWNGELYAGGSFTEAGTETVSNVAKWDGTSWSPVGSGRPTYVHEFCDWNGKLVAGGLYNGNTDNSVAYWDGSSWNGMGFEGFVYALTVYEYNGSDHLIAGGFFFGESGMYNIAFYTEGYGWLEFEGGVIHSIYGEYAEVLDLQVYGNNLVVSGYFTDVGESEQALGIATWNENWSALEGGLGKMGRGYALLIDEQEKCLYVAGNFGVTGTTKVENMGKYIFGKVRPGPPDNPGPTVARDFTVHPNPFNPVTTIKYSLDVPANVTIEIYDVAGRCVKTLKNDRQPAGEYTVSWGGKDNLGNAVTSGVYFAKLAIGDPGNRAVETRKLILLR